MNIIFFIIKIIVKLTQPLNVVHYSHTISDQFFQLHWVYIPVRIQFHNCYLAE